MAEASADIVLGDVARLFGFGLVKYHPDLAENDADDIIDAMGLSKASELLGEALAATLGAGEADAETMENPPKASRKSKTGSRS